LGSDVTDNTDLSFLAAGDDDPRRLAQALRESHELLALAEQSAGIGIWDTDLSTDRVRGTPTFFRIMGLPVCDQPIPNDLVRAVRHPEDAPRVREGFRAVLAEGRDLYEVEYRIIRPSDGELRWIFGRGRARRDASGKPVRYSGVDIDITERKQAEEHVRLLMHELNHRSNNLLTVIQALARLTATSAEARDFAERLAQRILGLAASSNLLVSGKWQGVEIEALVRSQLAHFVADLGDRLALAGPSLRLSASAAQAIGMALYELATNAVKHGALANACGHIHIRWSVTEGGAAPLFTMSWCESGGPPVTAPTRSGFGRIVMERMTGVALNGKANLQFEPTGIVWSLVCPAGRALESR
jgi:PAS domain S-box-containing protein